MCSIRAHFGSNMSILRPFESQCFSRTHEDHDRTSKAKLSVGSFGHPQLCHQPCILMRHGSCSAGSACSFCHCSHSNRTRFSRNQRDEINRLGEADVLALVLPHLLAKKLPAQEVIALLEAHLISLPSEARPGMRINVQLLNRCLARMQFWQLVDMCECKERSEIREAMLNLQAIIAAQDPATYEQSFSV